MTQDTLDTVYARAVEALLIEQIERDDSRRSAPKRIDGEAPARSQRRELIGFAAVALLVGAIVAGLFSVLPVLRADRTGSPADTGLRPAPSATVGDRVLPYAGDVPWSNAVADPSDPRRITIYADGDSTKGPIFVCGLPAERVQLRVTGTDAVIAVRGYSAPLPDGDACGSPGHAPQPLTVELPVSGVKRLIDPLTGTSRPILDPHSVPTVTALNAGLITPDTEPLTWDDATGVAVRRWIAGPRGKPFRTEMTLSYGTSSDSAQQDDPRGRELPSVTVDSAEARLWQHTDELNWNLDMRWRLPNGHEAVLWIDAPPDDHPTQNDVIAAARSVRLTSTTGSVSTDRVDG